MIVSPSGLPARVRAIHAQNQAAMKGGTGERCALNLAGDGIGKDAIHRGDTICASILHAPSARIDAEFRLLASESRPVNTWMPVRLHHAAANVSGRIVPLSATRIAPGESGLVQLVLDAPIAATVGDRFVLRDTSAQRTIGGGRFLDLRAPARKRRTPERLTQLAAGEGEAGTALAAMLDTSPFWLDLAAFARDRALPFEAARGMAERLSLILLPVAAATLVFSDDTWERMRHGLIVRLAAFHADNPDLMGIGQERLRLALEPRLPAPAFRACLHGLAADGTITIEGAWVRLASHSVSLSPADEARWSRIAALIGGPERFRPPRVRDIAGLTAVPEAEIRRIMKLMGRLGRVDEVAQDHFFLRGTVSEMVDIVNRLSQSPAATEFTASQFRDEVENGRKVAIQILEFLDRHGVTLRRGDLRRVNPHRLDLFRSPSGRA